MTDEQCEICKHRPRGYVGGEFDPVWTCDKIDDPKMPFDMERDTPCPCFEKE